MTLIHAERFGVNQAAIAPLHYNLTTHNTFIRNIKEVEIFLQFSWIEILKMHISYSLLCLELVNKLTIILLLFLVNAMLGIKLYLC